MGESSSDLMEATPPSSPPPVHHSRHHDHGWRGGGSRLAALLRVRRQKLLRQEQEGRRNLSDSESLGGSVRCRCGTHKGLSRNNSTQSAQSAATVHTLVSSSTASSNRRASEDGLRQSSMSQQDGRGDRWARQQEDQHGDDTVTDGVHLMPEGEMNAFQKTIPGLKRHDPKTSTIRQHYYPEGGWGWLICACVFVVHMLTTGMQFSFGVLYTDLLRHIEHQRSMDACEYLAEGLTEALKKGLTDGMKEGLLEGLTKRWKETVTKGWEEGLRMF